PHPHLRSRPPVRRSPERVGSAHLACDVCDRGSGECAGMSALEAAIARWEAMTGKPFRDPEPTTEEIEQARARADEAMMGSVWCFLAQEGERVLQETDNANA